MSKSIFWKILIAVLVAIPLGYGLMPTTDSNLDQTTSEANAGSVQQSNSSHDTAANVPAEASQQTSDIFPEQLSGMMLVGVQEGEAAMQGVSGMHGLDIELKNAYIASYEGNSKSAMIWISESNNDQEAQQLFQVMDEKMPNSESFNQYHAFNLKGQEYRYVFWPKRNMHNYYYVVGTRNYWVAVEAEDPMPFLSDVLKAFK